MYEMEDGTFLVNAAGTRCRIEPLPGGRWVATSHDLQGLMVSGASPDELASVLPDEIKAFRATIAAHSK